MSSLLWLRRDLRRADHPALCAAAGQGPVHPVFVIDPRLWHAAGEVRRGWLAATLQALDRALEHTVILLLGDPAEQIPRVAADLGVTSVHVSTETTPYGRRRDEAVRQALACDWVETGSPYAVTPGRIRKDDGTPYRVFTPFARAWRAHGWRAPAVEPEDLALVGGDGHARAWSMLDTALQHCPIELPAPGEAGALARWRDFGEHLAAYGQERDRPDHEGTSRMSPYLKYGVVHPRTLLADIDQRSAGAKTFVTELAWREFYADVLHHQPRSAWTDLKPLALSYDADQSRFHAWARGRTGFPMVDAGMRQLAASGWMHNRVRMITASFLTKDLHQWWPAGARHFLAHLLDGDLASNNHGWQWTAGTGTDASPYFRVFNPITQGEKFDPHGDYVRRWVPELAHLAGRAAHRPWDHAQGYAHGYPTPIVDHAQERRVALQRYQQARG